MTHQTIIENLKEADSKPSVRLVGSDGNAFAVIGAVLKAGRRHGWSQQEQEAVQQELTSDDYNHLIWTANQVCIVS